jgi:hypothetical protein
MTKPTDIQKKLIEVTYALVGESLALNSNAELSIRGQRIAQTLADELEAVKDTLVILEDEIKHHQQAK